MHNTLTTYQELENHIDFFLQGVFECMVIASSPGLGKSALLEEKLQGFSHYIVKGKLTPLALYGVITRFQDSILVFDDVDQFRGESISLLKSLCETSTVKTISWLSSRKLPEDLPSTVHTSSRVIILTNSWQNTSIHLSALESRGMVIAFQPINREVHQRASLFTSPEVSSYITRYLPLIPEGTLTLRLYVLLDRMATLGTYWQGCCLGQLQLPPSEYAYAMNELRYAGEGMRKTFMATTGKAGTVYDRIHAQIEGG